MLFGIENFLELSFKKTFSVRIAILGLSAMEYNLPEMSLQCQSVSPLVFPSAPSTNECALQDLF